MVWFCNFLETQELPSLFEASDQRAWENLSLLCDEFESLPLDEPEGPHAASGNAEDIPAPEQKEMPAEPSQIATLEQTEGTSVEQGQAPTQEKEFERSDQPGLNESIAQTPEKESPAKPSTPTARRTKPPAISPVPAKSSASSMPQEHNTSEQPATPTAKRSRKLPKSFADSPPAQTPTPKQKKSKKGTTPRKGKQQIASKEPDLSMEPAAKKVKLQDKKAISMKVDRPV